MHEQHKIFSGDYSEDMWRAIRGAKTEADFRSALYLICDRLCEFEARVGKHWINCCEGQPERFNVYQCKKPFRTWKRRHETYIVAFGPNDRQVGNLMSHADASRLCQELNECWAFSKERE